MSLASGYSPPLPMLPALMLAWASQGNIPERNMIASSELFVLFGALKVASGCQASGVSTSKMYSSVTECTGSEL